MGKGTMSNIYFPLLCEYQVGPLPSSFFKNAQINRKLTLVIYFWLSKITFPGKMSRGLPAITAFITDNPHIHIWLYPYAWVSHSNAIAHAIRLIQIDGQVEH